MPTFNTLLGLLATAMTVNSLGINCRGSGACEAGGDNSDIATIQGIICAIDPDRFYNNGDQLACNVAICAFFQNKSNGGGTAGQACGLVGGLLDHGCQTCGSNPTEPGNDVSTGELTINYVSNPNPLPPYKMRLS